MMLAFFFTGQCVATTSLANSCPLKFIGTVTKVSELQAPFSQIKWYDKKVTITFNVIETLQGPTSQIQEVVILKNAVQKFELGKTYEIEKRAEYFCRAKEL